MMTQHHLGKETNPKIRGWCNVVITCSYPTNVRNSGGFQLHSTLTLIRE